MPNPFTCTCGRWGRGTAKSSLQWKSPLRWDPRALPGSLGLCLGAVRHGGGAWWLLFLLASRSHGSRRQHRGSCGMRELLPAEPILISFPLPRLAGATAHPVEFQGDSRGNQRTPHNCDCTGGGGGGGGGKKFLSLSLFFQRGKKLFIQKSESVVSTWFVLHAIPLLPHQCR